MGVLAFYGIARYLPESRPAGQRLDLFGFATLSLAVGLFQMFLDRGEHLDWFQSVEIRLEAAGCAVAFALFVAHTWTTDGPSFLDRALLKDRNFVTGVSFAFVVGMILYATMALLPNLLQGLLGYPVVYTGEVMAPRGIGTMLAMLVVGRLMNRFDVRTIMAVGFALTVFSLWQMTGMTLEMGSRLVVVSGFLQGLGIGFTFVPLSAATFASLAPSLRNEGTPIYSLLRNIGSSVGISIVQLLLTEHMAQAHADLAADVSLSNPALAALPAALSPATTAGPALLNAQVDRQAAMMAYVFDFRAMMVLAALAMPFLLLIRRASKRPAAGDAAMAADAH